MVIIVNCKNCNNDNRIEHRGPKGSLLWGRAYCAHCGEGLCLAAVGDAVKFRDEFDVERIGRVTRIVPRGEFSPDSVSLAIGTQHAWGTYVRLPEDVNILTSL